MCKNKNGTLITFRDSYSEYGKNTKTKGEDIRVGVIIDTNRLDEIAILKQQHSLNTLSVEKRTFNPNIKTKNYKHEPLKIDGNNVRSKSKTCLTPDEDNE